MSVQSAVKYQVDFLGKDLKEGDVIMSNSPQAGGT
jgi:5-oxoprolinase (ATP-hydrolysing)